MIFPNQRRQPQMRPAMGYAPGARTFGRLMPVVPRLGYVAHIGYSSGAWGLGAISPQVTAVAVNSGWNSDDLAQLSAAGATDQDIVDMMEGTKTISALFTEYGIGGSPQSSGTVSAAMAAIAVQAGVTPAVLAQLITAGADDEDIANLLDGNISLAQLQSNYGVVSPVSSPGTVMATSTSTAQVVPGSVWNYTISYAVTLTNFVPTAAAFVAAFQAGLGALGGGYSLSSTNILQNPTLTGTVQIQFVIAVTGVGNALQSDMKGNLDGLSTQIIGSSGITGSTLSPVSSPAATSAAAGVVPAAVGESLTTWFENNAAYIGIGVVALVGLKAFMDRK